MRHTAFSSFGILYLVRVGVVVGTGGRGVGGSAPRTTTPPTPVSARFFSRSTPHHPPSLTQGGFQYWLYNIQFTKMCAPLTARFGHRGVAPVKVFLDQAVHHPLLYFPFFYGLKAFVEGKPLASAATKYKAEAWESCQALWKVWVPAQLVNFAFVPRHLRIPYVAAVSFGWTVILSTMQGSFDARDKEAAAAGGGGDVGVTARAPLSTLTPPPPTKKGGDVTVASVPPPRGLKDVVEAPGLQPGGAILAASRAESAALVAACAAGGGAMPPQ